jgi:hypothetical protein
LGRYLLAGLEAEGATCGMMRANRCLRDAGLARLLQTVDDVDLFVLASPLYVDSLPYLVTRCLERIADHRAGVRSQAADAGVPGTGCVGSWSKPARGPRFLAILNCGFPEAEHNRVALDICRAFARRAGLEWAGGLALGGGEAIPQTPLAEAGALVRHVREALDLTAVALLAGAPVPERAVELMARPLVPDRVYTAIGAIRWLRAARSEGTLRRMADRPFEDAASGDRQ